MTILLTGGGTGGHITPLLAVARELKRLQPTVRIVYVGERGSALGELTSGHEAIDARYAIWAGKYRRYHGESFMSKLRDVKTLFLNVRDVFYFLAGTVQSWLLLRKIRPDIVLLKGGFVGVPVGLAAAAQGIPFVTHDSDAIPGLANRLVSRWAAMHAVAMAPEQYAYPPAKTQQVGVLVDAHFTEVDAASQAAMKTQVGVPPEAVMLLVTGGSSGAVRLNEALTRIAPTLLQEYPELHIVHQTGKGKHAVYGAYAHDRLHVLEFMHPMYVFTGAADIVVARASANTVAELGVQHKAVIVVPSPFLAGGHQLKNARLLADAHAAVVVSETEEGTDAVALLAAVRTLLNEPAQRAALAQRLHALSRADAAARLAGLLLSLHER